MPAILLTALIRKPFIISDNAVDRTTAGSFSASPQFSSPLALQQLLLLPGAAGGDLAQCEVQVKVDDAVGGRRR